VSIATIEQAVAALREGKPVIVADNEDRENEGDVIISAELATQPWIAWTVKHSSGLLCAPMTNEIADQLDLPIMVEHSEDVRGTAYTITVDAAEGVTTGISAQDRTTTLHRLAAADAQPHDVHRPGHILPLRAVDGGVRERPGHTEASIELLRLAGLRPVAAIAEIVADNGEMMRLPELVELGKAEDIPVTTIDLLVSYLNEQDATAPSVTPPRVPREHRRVSLRADTNIPTVHGTLRVRAYRDRQIGIDHLAISALDPDGNPPGSGALVRVHSECITGEAFGSLKCECGPQLRASLDLIHEHGGVVVYLRGQEGRGIGLANKLRAYALQEEGLDTLEANLKLGLPGDDRDYAAAAEILDELEVRQIRMLTNNPDKMDQLRAHGVDIVDRVPLLVDVNAQNEAYLEAKRDRMGHLLPEDLQAFRHTHGRHAADAQNAYEDQQNSEREARS
jgi:3,4-dihydroxy 2-butanone 4-phosphate synthase/GTP cyclohydrolase II